VHFWLFIPQTIPTVALTEFLYFIYFSNEIFEDSFHTSFYWLAKTAFTNCPDDFLREFGHHFRAKIPPTFCLLQQTQPNNILVFIYKLWTLFPTVFWHVNLPNNMASLSAQQMLQSGKKVEKEKMYIYMDVKYFCQHLFRWTKAGAWEAAHVAGKKCDILSRMRGQHQVSYLWFLRSWGASSPQTIPISVSSVWFD